MTAHCIGNILAAIALHALHHLLFPERNVNASVLCEVVSRAPRCAMHEVILCDRTITLRDVINTCSQSHSLGIVSSSSFD